MRLDSVEKIADHLAVKKVGFLFIKLFPHAKRFADIMPRAFVGTFRQTGDRCNGTFHKFYNFTGGYFIRLFFEPVSAFFAACAFDYPAFDEILGDDLKIFL